MADSTHPALFRQLIDGTAKVSIQFGGQASDYFSELLQAYHHEPHVQRIVDAVSLRLKYEAALPDAQLSGVITAGCDVKTWLSDESARPSRDYLSSSAISQPLIFLTQVVNVVSASKKGWDMSTLRQSMMSATGHSQGIMTAVLMAMELDEGDFAKTVADMASWLFWQGIRMQLAYPAYTIDPTLIAAIGEKNGGTPSPMMAVNGMNESDIMMTVTAFNRSASTGPVYLSLINGPDRMVLSGPPESLAQLALSFRAPEIKWQFLATSAPFHSPYMAPGRALIEGDLARLGIEWKAKQLTVPVYATNDGRNLQRSKNVIKDLLDMMFLQPVHWPKATRAFSASAGVTHVIDFGPGEAAAALTGMLCRGEGVAVLAWTSESGKKAMLTRKADDVPRQVPWASYAPNVIDGPHGPRLTNRFTAFTGHAPIFVGGMTPCTVEEEVVVAGANAGFIVEWAGGGQVTEAITRWRLDRMMATLEAGRGIIFNTLFMDPYLWNLHYPLVIKLKQEGYPILGVTISAGVPDPEKAVDILRAFNHAGIWCNAFKPGNDRQIEAVIEIAKRLETTDDPRMEKNILMHVEGGKAGGHHSWEDVRGLIRRYYSRIRQQSNIILCAGGGIWNGEQASAWLNGTWHGDADQAPMPVDAVFVGTRVMAAKEVKTSEQVKALLAEVTGTDEWVRKHQVKGGVTSGESQLGADIYYVDNSAAQTGRLLDGLAGKSKEEINKHRDEIVNALNKTCKPYFGDLTTMTYYHVLERMIALMTSNTIPDYIPSDGVWYDVTFRSRLFEFAKRAEDRFGKNGDRRWVTALSQLDDPVGFLDAISSRYPAIRRNVLHPEDVDYFIWLCKRPGKPVNFVPVIDENIRRYYKSDSLWQAHDPRYAADAVLTIPGPDAVQGITSIDEPVAEILQGLVEVAAKDAKKETESTSLIDGLLRARCWAIGQRLIVNPLQSFMQERDGGTISREVDEVGHSVVVARCRDRVLWQVSTTSRQARVEIIHTIGEKKATLVLEMDYQEGNQLAPYQMTEAAYRRAIRSLYESIWQIEKMSRSKSVMITSDCVRRFSLAVGETSRRFLHEHEMLTPLHAGFVVVFDRMLGEALRAAPEADVLKLVHTRNHLSGGPLTPNMSYTIASVDCEKWAVPAGLQIDVSVGLVGEDGIKRGITASFVIRGEENRGFAPAPAVKREYTPLTQAYTILDEEVAVPNDAAAYALASGDMNPIHLNRHLAVVAGFSDPIMHGMWTSSALAAVVARSVLGGSGERLVDWDAEFYAPVSLGERLMFSGRHVGMREGRRVLELTATTEAGVVALRAWAEVAAPKTAYLFTGQGSQIPGMGMEAYHQSAAARAVWEEADLYCQSRLGFSILDIVKHNPKELLVDGEKVSHPAGVLHLTQFTQVGLTVVAMAHVAQMKEAGVYIDNAIFAGHSLGEYAALSCSGIIPLQDVIPTVYHRGLTMQHFVPRDAEGRSPYAMAVVRPNIAGLSHADLEKWVSELGKDAKNGTLEVVNYNIRNEQYSVTGDAVLLKKLENKLREHATKKGSDKSPMIWLEGIDVPFHSTVLRPGVEAFRATLEKTIPTTFDPNILTDRYIPNLNAKPFHMSRGYIDELISLTDSPVLKALVKKEKELEKANIAAVRTVLIELLAYQFASPVQWIATQEWLLQSAHHVDQLIEVGPRPTLSVMAKRTATYMGRTLSGPTIYHIGADHRDIYCVKEENDERVGEVTEVVNTPAAPVVAASPVAAVTPPSGEGVVVVDAPLDVKMALKTVLALKLAMRRDEVGDADTIEKLCQGNSARRNEILADIGAEFGGGAIDDAHNKPIAELAALMSKKVNYAQPGSYLRVMTDKAIKEMLGINRGRIIDYLSTEWMLPPGRIMAVLNDIPLMVRGGDSTRSGALSSMAPGKRLASEAESTAWLDQLVGTFAAAYALSVAKRSTVGGGGGAMVDSQALEQLEARYFGLHSPFGDLAQSLAKIQGHDFYEQVIADDENQLEERRRLALYRSEMGEKTERVITGIFDPDKRVVFRSTWNWSRRDLINLFMQYKNNQLSTAELKSMAPSFKYRATPLLAKMARELARREPAMGVIADAVESGLDLPPVFYPTGRPTKPELIVENGRVTMREVPRRDEKDLKAMIKKMGLESDVEKAMMNIVSDGISLSGKTIFVTGAGPHSIASEVVKNMLACGARVIVTTSSYDYNRIIQWRKCYQQYGVRGSELVVVPMSQGSHADIQAVMEWLRREQWIVDVLIPFGAVSDLANTATLSTDGSTATLRVMLQGIHWLVAGIADTYRRQHVISKRCHVILPLSPNHGQFGGDGLYAETKRGLESLMMKWRSEQEAWGKYVTMAGAVIGWTRGTGLMEANDWVAPGIEAQCDVRTFSSAEMAFLLSAMAAPSVAALCLDAPRTMDLTGGFGAIANVGEVVAKLRQDVVEKVKASELVADASETISSKSQSTYFTFPNLPHANRIRSLRDQHKPLKKMTPDQCVVVVGMGELSPYGLSKSRFEYESNRHLSIEGTIDLAWLMGLIRYESGDAYVGWVDAATGEAVADGEIPERYEAAILANTGVRFTDVESHSFDPRQTTVLTDVVLEEPFEFAVDSIEAGNQFVRRHPDGAELLSDGKGGYRLRMKAGSVIKVPKAISLTRYVAGQIPKGFDPARLGIPKEMINQVDRITLFNIVATVDAFLSAGLTPQEIYDYIHPSRVGNTQGGGMGGMTAISDLYHNHREDKTRQSDTLQETLINVTAAWITQSYLGSYGPTVHPVGACATAVVSLDTGYNLIATGKADFIVTGGYDDYSEEGIIGFQDMQATCETEVMLKRGIPAHAMSRPNDQRRGGFVEAHGGGTMLITTLDKAVTMGLPVYAILALTATHSDGWHTSIPAPGLGLLAMKPALEVALEKYGLHADDIMAVSKHDTSTGANDPNENQLHHRLQQALGRSEGWPLLVHSQKAVLGHAKGGAGAWQSNVAVQMLNSGRVPGNPHLDDVDEAMAKYETMCFTDETIDCGPDGITAVMISSLGFGHVGAAALFLHPDLAMAILDDETRRLYEDRRRNREITRISREWRVRMGSEPYYEKRSAKAFDDVNNEANMLLR